MDWRTGESSGHVGSEVQRRHSLPFAPSLFSSLTVTRHHRTVTALRFRPRHIHLSPSVRIADGASWRVSGSPAVYPRGSRFVSTAPQPPTGPASKDVPPPVPTASPRKHKVELRPAPVKPPKPSSEAPPSPTASERAASSASVSESSSTPPGELEPPHDAIPAHPDHSVIQTAKDDYYDASKHGILKPPPADASWAGRLLHQGKELFVRTIHLVLGTPVNLAPEILLEWHQAHQREPETCRCDSGAREGWRGVIVAVGDTVHRELQAGCYEVSF